MSSWVYALLAVGALIFVTVALLCVIIRFHILDSVRNKFIGFILLLISGLFLYCILPIWAPPTKTTCECQSQVSGDGGEIAGVASAIRGISSANRVMTSFFPSRGGYETVLSDDLKIGQPWSELAYYIFHWLVIIYVGLLGLTIFGRHLTDKFRRWTMRHLSRNKMYVFWGDPEPARRLAKNLRSNEVIKRLGFAPRILFLLPSWLKFEDSARASIFRLSDKGYVLDFVDGLPSDNDQYNVVGREFDLGENDVAGRCHFLLSENSAYNIGLANAIIKKRNVAKSAYAAEKLDLYIRVENSASSSVLKDWADAMMREEKVKSSVNLDIHIFRETEIMAENFIEKYPILKHWNMNGVETDGWLLEGIGDQGVARLRDGIGRIDADGKMGLDVLIIGFGNRGQELLNIMLENSQFLDVDDNIIPTRFTIIDKCEVAGHCPTREVYKRRSPEIVEPPKGSQFKVVFVDRAGDVTEDGFKHFNIKVSDYDRIIVCTGNDELNVQIGDIVRREFIAQGVKLGKGRLFVQLQSENIEERERVKGYLIEYFGMWSDCFIYDGVVDENKHYGAKLLNWKYGHELELTPKREEVVESWKKLGWFNKESSIAAYRGMLNILVVMGYGLDIANSKNGAYKDGESLWEESKGEALMRLAQVEHLRWMAFLRTHGISRWDLENPSLEDIRNCQIAKGVKNPEIIRANVQELIGKHAWLVPNNDLPAISRQIAIYNGDYKADCELAPFIGAGDKFAREKNYVAQWNDMKFVNWISQLIFQLKCPRMKIVKMENRDASAETLFY